MHFVSNNIRCRYHLLFSLTWIFSLTIYPVWVEPTTVQIRYYIYSALVVWTIINILLFYNFLLKCDIQEDTIQCCSIKADQWTTALLSLLFINIVLHIYPISFPLMISDDEAAHASGGIGLISRLLWMKGLDPADYIGFIRISLWTFLLTTFMIFSFKGSRSFIQRVFSKINIHHYILFFASLLILSIIIFSLTKDMKFYMMLMRYPPMGKILYATSISLFGINEFSVRIPQLLFAVFTSYIIFKICTESLDSKEIGLISACSYAFSPMVFYYSSLGELICGTVFFSVLVMYLYLKYLKSMNNAYLILAFYFISLGFLYKRVIVIMIGVLVISILFQREQKISLSFLVKLCYFSLVPIIPFLIIGKVYPNNPFGLDLSNWLKPGPAFGYLAVLLKQLSYPLSVLAAVSVLFLFYKKLIFRPAVFVSFICFLSYYVLYTSSTLNSALYPLLYMHHKEGGFLIGTERYSMIFFPFISISIGLFVVHIAKLFHSKYSFKAAFSVLVLYLIAVCTVWHVPPLNAQFVAYRNIESHYFPVDKAMKWVRDNVKDGEKILILRVAPAAFYREKYGIGREKILDFWYNLERVSTPEKLKTLYRENKINYIMYSYNAAEEMDVLRYLKGYQGKELEEVTRYNYSGNYIFIYKIN